MKPGRGKKVVVAMSGGVDSSVAAALLKDEGYSVVGCFMRLGSEGEKSEERGAKSEERGTKSEECGAKSDERSDGRMGASSCAPRSSLHAPRSHSSLHTPRPHHQGCCSVDDAADARLVAAMLGMPFYVLNFRKDFGRIMDYFVAEYNAGRTPNPCVRCNDWLKFGKLAEYAKSIDADYIASGHYARVEHASSVAAAVSAALSSPSSLVAEVPAALSEEKSRWDSGRYKNRSRLLRGVDHRKDQSYVLFGVKRDALEHMLLPIGAMQKPAVRALAEDLKLPVFNKPDSQEICFVPDNDYASFVAKRSADKVRPGDVLDRAGEVVGRHPGQQHFTIGQRRGHGVTGALPLYVLNRDAASNTITVGGKEDLLAAGCTADQTNWLIDPPAEPLRCEVKVRYNGAAIPGTVSATGPDTLSVEFDEPQAAVTPGQAVVCYVGEELIGGGWIR